MTDVIRADTFDVAEPSAAARLWKRVRGHKGLIAGSLLFLAIVAVALTAPLIAPHDPYDQNLTNRLVPPIWYERGTWTHPLGTDNLGRDYLSRMLYGAQISLLIGVSVMLISGTIGTALGLAAGYFGGRIDMAITFLVTTRLALPVVLVALAVVAMVG
jgi:peptide/nickel transport system permease protein